MLPDNGLFVTDSLDFRRVKDARFQAGSSEETKNEEAIEFESLLPVSFPLERHFCYLVHTRTEANEIQNVPKLV